MVPSARRPLRVRRWDGYALVSENRQNTSRLLTPGAQYRRRCHLLGPWTARRFRQTPLRTQHAYFGSRAEAFNSLVVDHIANAGGTDLSGLVVPGHFTLPQGSMPGLQFKGALFAGPVRFGRVKFGSAVDFRESVFRSDAVFQHMEVDGTGNFSGVSFGDIANFTGAKFAGTAQFEATTFSLVARFATARFKGESDFSGATFHGDAVFQRAVFCRRASFEKAQFHRTTTFQDALIQGPTNFTP